MTFAEKLLKMDYCGCVAALLDRYGPVAKDYFTNERCNGKTPGITRTKEGLLIHHVDEDKKIMLSTPAEALKAPFAFQKAERLVYCNLLEHLILHIKICEHPNKDQLFANEMCGVGGIYNFIAPELNDIYSGLVYKTEWRRNVAETVLPLKEDYLKCIKRLAQRNFPFPLLTSYNERYGL